jgi:hypothetical protein
VRRASTSIVRKRPAAIETPESKPEQDLRPQQPVGDGSPTQEGTPQSSQTAALDEAAKEDAAKNDAAPDPAPVAEVASLTPRTGVIPPPMRGSLASLQRQNERSEAEGLERIENERDLSDRIAHKLLVPVPTSPALTINQDLPLHHRYCRPWTARFLADIAREHAAIFHGPLEVSSAVRTVEYQKRLIGVNGNAAAAEGQIVSPHLTGATIDIAKSAMNLREIGWMRGWLMPLQEAGKIDVEEEFQQACFHITVYGNYLPIESPSMVAHAGSKRSRRTGAAKPKSAQPRSRPDNSRTDNSAPETSDTTGGTVALGR